MRIEDVLKGHGVGVGGGSNIKSIQKGISSLSATTSIDVTVSDVDIENTIVVLTIKPGSTNVTTWAARAEMINSTTLRITRQAGISIEIVVGWQLIEFDDIKGVQKGTVVMTGTDSNISISPVDVEKSLLFVNFSVKTLVSQSYYSSKASILASIINPSTINFKSYEADEYTINWQVIEFK